MLSVKKGSVKLSAMRLPCRHPRHYLEQRNKGSRCLQNGPKEENNESIKLPTLLLEQEGSSELSSHLRVRRFGVLTLKQLQQTYVSAPPTGTICPPKALNLCPTLLAQKLGALNSPLVFFLATHAENEFGEERVTLGCPAPLPGGGGGQALERHLGLLGLQFPSWTLDFER